MVHVLNAEVGTNVLLDIKLRRERAVLFASLTDLANLKEETNQRGGRRRQTLTEGDGSLRPNFLFAKPARLDQQMSASSVAPASAAAVLVSSATPAQLQKVLPLARHRYTVGGVLFSLLVLVVSVLCGLFFPLRSGLDVNTSMEISFSRDTFPRDVMYYLSRACWMGRYVPQVMLNESRGRTEGLSAGGVFWDLMATGCNLCATLVEIYFLQPLQPVRVYVSEDTRRVIFAVVTHALCFCVSVQCYKSLEEISPLAKSVFWLLIVLSAIYFAVLLSSNVSISRVATIAGWTQVMSLLYVAFSMLRFLPQLRRNNKYRLVLGVDINSTILDIVGGVCLILFVVFSGSYDNGGTPLIVHGGSVCFLGMSVLFQTISFWYILPLSELRTAIEKYICEASPEESAGYLAAFSELVRPAELTVLEHVTMGESEDGCWVCCRCTLSNELTADACAVCHLRRDDNWILSESKGPLASSVDDTDSILLIGGGGDGSGGED